MGSMGFVGYIARVAVDQLGYSMVPESVRWSRLPLSDWAYLLPAWSIMLFLFIYVGFVSWNVFQTPPMDALELVVGT